MKVTHAFMSNETAYFQKINISTQDLNEAEQIELFTNKQFQQMDGFGASFTDSAAFLVDKVLDTQQKSEVMERLFTSDKGINLSLIRNPMGASDYARTIYSYNDLEGEQTDSKQEHFSIDHDKESILPLTQEAIRLNPKLKVMASPWSPPAWMKDSGSMKGGQLLEEFYDSYALYFVKFIKAYEENGVQIYGVTPQNEALYEPLHYPSMLMEANAQVKFVRDHLKPSFIDNNIKTKIFGYDHNWDRIDYPLELLDNAYDAFDGIAWHWYGGKTVSQSRVQQIYPEKEVHFTEGSGGEWIPAFEPAFSNLMRTSINILRHGSRSLILWNMALDENNGPTVPGFGESTCRGLVTVNQSQTDYEFTLDYYGLGHFSKHVQVGASRIDSQSSSHVKHVAFLNPDKSVVLVAYNDSEDAVDIQVNVDEEATAVVNISGKSAVTLVYS